MPNRTANSIDITMVHAALDTHVTDREEESLALLRQMISTPSLSGNEGRHDEPGTIAELLARSFEPFTGVVRGWDEAAPGRETIIGVVRGGGDGIFVLDAHTDTVPGGDPSAWFTTDPFAPADGVVEYLGGNRVRLTVGEHAIERPIRARHGRLWEARPFQSAPVIYGRGSFDNKGPVAVAWLATVAVAETLADLGLRLGGTLVCAFPIDEELGMLGTRSLAAGPGSWLDRNGMLPREIGPDGFRLGIEGVALDGSYGFVPVVGHRGIAQFQVTTRGQAAHAATPTLGRSAVLTMSRILAALDTHADIVQARLAPLFDDELLEPVSLALGTTIVGGGVERVETTAAGARVHRQGINVVADWCQATIDCRHPRPADRDNATIRERLASELTELAIQLTGVTPSDLSIEVISGGPPCAIADSPEDGLKDPLIGAIVRHGETVSGFAPWIETAPGGTDATIMVNHGAIKTIVEFGPAGGFAHEPHEYVERDQIAVGARILARTIIDRLGVVPV